MFPREPRLPKLDERLACALELVPKCRTVADIGADHGRLSLHLLKSKTCQHVIVSDVSEHSLMKAKRLLRFHQEEGRATFVCADGLAALTMPVDAVVILGLGGSSISRILEMGRQQLGQAQLIVSAQTETHKLRRTLVKCGYAMVQERVVRTLGRYYTVIQAVPGIARYTDRELYLGPTLVGTPSAKLADYLCWRMDVLAMAEGAQDSEQMNWLREALAHAHSDCGNDLSLHRCDRAF